MARSFFVVMVVVALLLSSTMAAKSLATSPIPTPHKKSSHLSRAVSPSTTVSTASPSTRISPSSGSSTSALSSISSTPPSGAPGPAQNAAVLNKFTIATSAAVVVFSATLLV